MGSDKKKEGNVELGFIIDKTGKKRRIDKVIEDQDKIKPRSSRYLSARDPEKKKPRKKVRCINTSPGRNKKARQLPQDEIIAVDMKINSKSYTMDIIGLVMILCAQGEKIEDVSARTIYEILTDAGYGISRNHVQKTLQKIKDGKLGKALSRSEKISLIQAYKLYLGK